MQFKKNTGLFSLIYVPCFAILLTCALPPSPIDHAPEIAYLQTSIVLFKGKEITAFKPKMLSYTVIDGYSIAPNLPHGLAIDPVTGILSGAPDSLLKKKDFVVTATNQWGSDTAALSITVMLASPDTIDTSAVSDSGIRLTWSTVKGVDTFIVYRSDITASNFKRIRTVKDTTVLDTTIAAGVAYYYYVAALSGSDTGAHSDTLLVPVPSSPNATSHTIIASVTGGGTITPSGNVIVNNGEPRSFAFAPTDTASTEIKGVLVDNVSITKVSPYTFTGGTDNHTISVAFGLKRFPLTITQPDPASGAISKNTTKDTVDYGTKVVFTATPASSNYVFGSWSGIVSVANPCTVTVTGSLTVGASFSQKGQSTAPSFSMAANATFLVDNQSIVLTDTAGVNTKIYYTTDGTTIPTTASAFHVSPCTLKVSSTTTIKAASLETGKLLSPISSATFYRAFRITTTASPSAGGTVLPLNPEVIQGASQTFAIDTNPGYTIAGVTLNGNAQGKVKTSTLANVQTAHTVTASFLPAVPMITTNPVNTPVFLGDTATFSVLASGIGLTYQWQMGTVNINGATLSTYKFRTDTTFNGKTFRCVVGTTPANGTTISAPATLTVTNTFSDIDGNVYHTVKIGNQVWMSENLKTTRFRDGTLIVKDTSAANWGIFSANPDSGKYCWYNNDSAENKNLYGALYNWYTVKPASSKKIAPAGWHVPTDAEWDTLQNYLGGNSIAGGALKEIGTARWTPPNTGATNSSGFSGLPGGFRNLSGSFYYQSSHAFWWSTTGYASNAFYRSIYYNDVFLNRDTYRTGYGFSARLVRDSY